MLFGVPDEIPDVTKMRSTRGGGGLGEVSLPPKAPRGAFHH